MKLMFIMDRRGGKVREERCGVRAKAACITVSTCWEYQTCNYVHPVKSSSGVRVGNLQRPGVPWRLDWALHCSGYMLVLQRGQSTGLDGALGAVYLILASWGFVLSNPQRIRIQLDRNDHLRSPVIRGLRRLEFQVRFIRESQKARWVSEVLDPRPFSNNIATLPRSRAR